MLIKRNERDTDFPAFLSITNAKYSTGISSIASLFFKLNQCQQ